MRIVFSKNAWEDYTSWGVKNRKMLRKINELIKDIQRTPFEGKGKPEPLKYDLAGLTNRDCKKEKSILWMFLH